MEEIQENLDHFKSLLVLAYVWLFILSVCVWVINIQKADDDQLSNLEDRVQSIALKP